MKHVTRISIALLCGLGGAQAISAHAKLVSANPANGSVVKVAPHKLDLMFNEVVSAKLSGAAIKPAGGKALPATAAIAQNGKSLSLTLNAPLKPGAYTVDWHAVASDDGHRTSGTYTFSVR